MKRTQRVTGWGVGGQCKRDHKKVMTAGVQMGILTAS